MVTSHKSGYITIYDRSVKRIKNTSLKMWYDILQYCYYSWQKFTICFEIIIRHSLFTLLKKINQCKIRKKNKFFSESEKNDKFITEYMYTEL